MRVFFTCLFAPWLAPLETEVFVEAFSSSVSSEISWTLFRSEGGFPTPDDGQWAVQLTLQILQKPGCQTSIVAALHLSRFV